jgi:hypothetical protein
MGVETEEAVGRPKPPYVGWNVFKQRILVTIRNRRPAILTVDELCSWDMERSTAKKALAACKALGIADRKGAPNRDLWIGLQQSGEEHQRAVRQMLETAYAPLLSQFEDITTVPPDHLRAKFAQVWHIDSPSSRDAAVSFFAGLCAEAGVPVSLRPSGEHAERRDAKPATVRRLATQGKPPPAAPQVPGASPQPAIVVAIQITGDEDEAQIESALRKVRGAWARVFGGGS